MRPDPTSQMLVSSQFIFAGRGVRFLTIQDIPKVDEENVPAVPILDFLLNGNCWNISLVNLRNNLTPV